VHARRLVGRQAILRACHDHPYTRFALGMAGTPTGVADGEAVLWVAKGPLGRIAHGLGPLDAVRGLIHRAGPVGWINMPRLASPPPGFEVRDHWDFRWSPRAAPAQAGQERVVPVEDAAAVNAVLDAAFPDSMLRPGHPLVRRWYGVWERDALVACAADRSAGDVGVLGAIAVHPDHRRRGLGAAVTAALTTDLHSEYGLVGLGVIAGNEAATRLYERLGFTAFIEITSVRRTPA
jgi:GNAT superfamily N-acetyltransferase